MFNVAKSNCVRIVNESAFDSDEWQATLRGGFWGKTDQAVVPI
jgi:hypothetical protein